MMGVSVPPPWRTRILLGAALVATGIGILFGIATKVAAADGLLPLPAISAPSVSVQTPIVQVNTPSVAIRPAENGLVPQVNADLPIVKVETSSPPDESPLPAVEVVVPKTEIALPPILPVPALPIKLPEVKATLPAVVVEVPKLPSTPSTGVNIKLPSVTITTDPATKPIDSGSDEPSSADDHAVSAVDSTDHAAPADEASDDAAPAVDPADDAVPPVDSTPEANVVPNLPEAPALHSASPNGRAPARSEPAVDDSRNRNSGEAITEVSPHPVPQPARQPISRHPISDFPIAYLGNTGNAISASGSANTGGSTSGGAPWNVLAFTPGEFGILQYNDPVGRINYEYLLSFDQWSKPPPDQPPMHDLLATR